MTSILPSDRVQITPLDQLDPVTSINGADSFALKQGDKTRRVTVDQIREGRLSAEQLTNTLDRVITLSIIPNSHLISAWTVQGTNAGIITSSSDVPFTQIGSSISFTHNGITGGSATNLIYANLPTDSFKAGEPLTFSVWAKGSVSNLSVNGVFRRTGIEFGSINTGTKTLTTVWKRYTFTFTPTEYQPDYRYEIRLSQNNIAGTVFLYGMRLELGSIATQPNFELVNLSRPQTITGVKTFSSITNMNADLKMAANTTIDGRKIRAWHDGNEHALAAVCRSTAVGISAANFASTNPNFTAVQVTGQEEDTGTIKLSHEKPPGPDGNDSGAAALSIDLKNKGNGQTAAQGIFITSTDGGTTGNYLTIRSGSTQHLRFTGVGRLGVGTGYATPGGKVDIQSDADNFPSLIVRPFSSTSTADLFQARNSSASVRTRIDSEGELITLESAFFNGSGIQVGSTTPQFGGGNKVIGITNVTAVPTTNPAAGGVLFSEGGVLKWLGSSGSAVELSTGNFNALNTAGTVAVGGTLNVDGLSNLLGSATVGTQTGTSSYLVVRGAAGNNRDIRFQSGTSDRFRFRLGNDAESGSNAGSTLQLNACADNGGFIDSPITIGRAAGTAITINRPTAFNRLTTIPSTPSTGFSLYADTNHRFSWKGNNGFVRSFDATGITADRVYTLPDASGTIAFTDRSTHTGSQPISSVTGLQVALDAKVESSTLPSFLDAKANLNGAAFTGDVIVGLDTASSSAITVRSAAGSLRDLKFQSGLNDRWRFRINSNTESGSDAGSDFQLNACSDVGNFIDSPISIVRAAGGAISLNRPIITGVSSSTNHNVIFRGAAGSNRDLRFQSGTSDRWRFRINNTAEAGSDAGSNFELNALTDAGVFIDSPIAIARVAGGAINLNRPITVGATSDTATSINIRGAAGSNRDVIFSSGASGRFRLRCSSGAESGSNTGSTFEINALGDTGSIIDVPVRVNRASGTNIELNRPVAASSTVTASQFRLSALNTAPTSATDTGTAGEIRVDSNFIYVATGTNQWKRAALTTW